MISVIGFGSLLSQASARQTAPSLENFRYGTVAGHKRIFNKVGMSFFKREQVEAGSLEISSCATREDSNFSIICSVFECTERDFLAIYEREHLFKWIEVNCNTDEGVTKGRMCTEYNDSDYLLNKCVTESEYHRRVGQYYSGRIWRSDIFPYPPYLERCLHIAKSQGEKMLKNFLDTTFLADGETSIRSFIADKNSYLSLSDERHSCQQD